MNISKHITYEEATFSQTAQRKSIDNTPNEDQISNMRLLAENVFEPMREYFGVPIRVNSFFRSARLNEAVGGSPTSQHCKGEAIDISVVRQEITNADLFRFIQNNRYFDQLIWEFGDDDNPEWVHVSYCEKNRGEVLRSVRQGGKVVYLPC